MENFEEQLRKDLHQFLLSMKEVDERMPECPDVEEKWEEIAKVPAPALPVWGRDATEAYGVSHDKDELI